MYAAGGGGGGGIGSGVTVFFFGGGAKVGGGADLHLGAKRTALQWRVHNQKSNGGQMRGSHCVNGGSYLPPPHRPPVVTPLGTGPPLNPPLLSSVYPEDPVFPCICGINDIVEITEKGYKPRNAFYLYFVILEIYRKYLASQTWMT